MAKRIMVLLIASIIVLFVAGCGVTGKDFMDGNVSSPSSAPSVTPESDPYAVSSLSGVYSADEIAELDKYTNLRSLDLSGSTCYDAILNYIASHPEVSVRYNVTLDTGTGSEAIDSSAHEIVLQSSVEARALAEHAAYLPQITTIDACNAEITPDDISALKAAYTEANILFSLYLNGISVSNETTDVNLSGMTSSDIDSITKVLPLLSNLETVNLMRDDGTSPFTIDNLGAIQQAAPDAAYNYSFELFGKTVSTSDESLEYVAVNIGNAGVDEIRKVLPYMSKLTYLKLDSCFVDSEVMAKLRDDFPDIKVVWRVWFSGGADNYNCLTDTEKIWATGSVTDGFTKELNYCTDVKYIDLGHDCITNIDFVNYMPKIEVAIFAITWVESIEPLANCPNLEYLEIFSSHVTDITPLASCTNLKHLNISNLKEIKDITCLYGLDLERLYVTMSYIPEEQQQEFQALHPNCECEFGWKDPSKYGWRFTDGYCMENEDSINHRVPRYALLCEQFGYDTFDYSK